MIVPGGLGFAFGNARLRAMKSRLRGREDLRLFRTAPTVAALATAAGLEPQRGIEDIRTALLESLLADYRKISEAYRAGAPLFDALLRLHEVENLKLGWRALARGLPARRWVHLWRPLERAQILRLEDWRDAASLRDAARHVRGTRYEGIVGETIEAHEADPAAAEMALDRWAWAAVVEQARRLPARERAARELALALVRERDLDALRRCVASYGLPAEVAPAATILLREEEKADRLREIARWSPEAGSLDSFLPRGLSRRIGKVAGWNGLWIALRLDRRDRCLRAFRGYPFRLAPPLAYLLLREEETRSLAALAQSKITRGAEASLEGVLAASGMDDGKTRTGGASAEVAT